MSKTEQDMISIILLLFHVIPYFSFIFTTMV